MITVVTGGSRGIGRAIAAALAAKGSDLLLVARDSDRLKQTAADLHARHKVQVNTLVADLAREAEVDTLAQHCIARSLIPDLLVLNAGIFREGTLLQSEPTDYRATMDVNLNSIYYLVRHLAPHMKDREKPRIVLIASTAAYEPYPIGALYGVAKWALRGYAINLRRELMPLGIGVTLLSPGGTLTDLWAGEELPVDRLLRPSDVGEIVALLPTLSRQAVVEEVIIRPMLGDIHE